MGEQIELPDRAIVHADGRPQAWFSILLRKLSSTVDGVIQFVDPVNGLALNADDIEQGINQRVRDIVNEQIQYNADGIVSSITRRDIETDEILAVEEFNYRADGTVETIVEKTPQATVTESVEYNGVDIDKIVRDIAIGGLF